MNKYMNLHILGYDFEVPTSNGGDYVGLRRKEN